MLYLHNCRFKDYELPDTVMQMEYRERCEVCGQVWKVIRGGGRWEGKRVRARFLNIKNWLWQRSLS